MSEETFTLEARARRRVGLKLGFYVHAAVFVLVNAGLYLLMYVQSDGLTGTLRWRVWPLGGWALGLAIHGLVTFVSLRGEGLRERMLAREIETLRRRDASR